MAFLAPLVPFLAKGAAALGTSLLGSKLSKAKSTPQETTVLNQDAEAQKLALDAAKTNVPNAQNLISMGSGAFQPVLNYWAGILSGNRGAATSALAPEISRIGQGYQQANQTSAALNPRGGPSASFLSQLPYMQQRDVSTLLQTARPQAANSLFQTGKGVADTGTNLLSNAINAIYGSTAAGRDILNQQQKLRETEAERGKAIGGGLFDLLQKYGFPAIDKILGGMGKGKGGDMSQGAGY